LPRKKGESTGKGKFSLAKKIKNESAPRIVHQPGEKKREKMIRKKKKNHGSMKKKRGEGGKENYRGEAPQHEGRGEDPNEGV